MTLTYLRGGLSSCSVVLVCFQYFFLQFIKVLMQLCKNFLYNFRNYNLYLLFPEPRLRNSFSGVRFCCACLRLYVLV